MMVDGPRRNEQARCDVRVAQAFVDEAQDLDLARGQPCRIGARRWSRAARAGCDQLPVQAVAETTIAEGLEDSERALQLLRVIAIRESDRALVRPMGPFEGGCGLSPPSGDLQGVR